MRISWSWWIFKNRLMRLTIKMSISWQRRWRQIWDAWFIRSSRSLTNTTHTLCTNFSEVSCIYTRHTLCTVTSNLAICWSMSTVTSKFVILVWLEVSINKMRQGCLSYPMISYSMICWPSMLSRGGIVPLKSSCATRTTKKALTYGL